MALKRILLASYAGQIYVALIGIVMMPVYLRYLGAESYGLIGFFAMLQAWMQLLDLGLTPTLSRETARFNAGVLEGAELKRLLRSLEWFFGSLAVITVVGGVLLSPWLSTSWLRLENLNPAVASQSLVMMGVIIAVRWFAALYRSGLVGMERQVSVNVAAAIFATFKFVGVVFVLEYISASVTAFFAFQMLLACLEAFAFRWLLYRALPNISVGFRFALSAIKRVLPFASGIAFTAGLWVVIVNLDKLLLSHFLSLSDYGYFSLAIALANGVTLLNAPLLQAVSPRMTILVSQKKEQELINFYRTVTQFTTALMVSIAGVLAMFAEPLLLAWTGSREAASAAAPILFWYALGNGVVGVLSLPYLLQYAHGYLRLHVLGNIVFGVVLVPTIAFAAWKYGAIGAGITWFAENLAFLLLWVPLVHARLARGIMWSWPLLDVLMIAVVGSAVLWFAKYTLPLPDARLAVLVSIAALFAVAVAIVSAVGSKSRSKIITMFRNAKHAA